LLPRYFASGADRQREAQYDRLGPDAKIWMTFDAAVLDWPATRFLLIDLESL
jgi:hypothetical protein